ncbi:hypothetical protein IWQ61_001664 [Dispira simplex]|nr:hypothetical protein IWQ61_001664 [Dispira simplex]
MVGGVVFGFMSDRFQVRHVPMCLMLLILAVATILLGVANAYWQLVVGRLIQGLAGGGTWAISFGMITDIYSPTESIRLVGTVMACSAMGTLLGPTLGGFLYEAGGRKAPFIFGGCLVALDLVLRLLIGETVGWNERMAARAGNQLGYPSSEESGPMLEAGSLGWEDRSASAGTRDPPSYGFSEKDGASATPYLWSVSLARSSMPHLPLFGPPSITSGEKEPNVMSHKNASSATMPVLGRPAASRQRRGGVMYPLARFSSHPITTTDPTISPGFSASPTESNYDGTSSPKTCTIAPPTMNNPTTSLTSTVTKVKKTNVVDPLPPIKTSTAVKMMLTSWRLLMCFFTSFAASIVVTSVETILPIHAQSLFGMSPGPIGLLFIAMVLPNAVVSPILGHLAVRFRWDSHWTMSISILVLALMVPMVPLASAVWNLVVVLVFTGAGAASVMFSPTLYMVGHMQERGIQCYSVLFALNNVFTAGGMLVGPIISGNLYETLTFLQTNLIICGVLVGLALAVSCHKVKFFFTDRRIVHHVVPPSGEEIPSFQEYEVTGAKEMVTNEEPEAQVSVRSV